LSHSAHDYYTPAHAPGSKGPTYGVATNTSRYTTAQVTDSTGGRVPGSRCQWSPPSALA
jgi:hypothetical protein